MHRLGIVLVGTLPDFQRNILEGMPENQVNPQTCVTGGHATLLTEVMPCFQKLEVFRICKFLYGKEYSQIELTC